MRALNDRGLLDKVEVISSVSGGSVIAGLYAYKDQTFASFDTEVVEVLRCGLQRRALKHLLSPKLLLPVIATNIIARPVAAVARFRRKEPWFRRWASRTDSLEAALADVLGEVELPQVAREKLEVVFNACDLRTGTAFRFGSSMSGSWRTGRITNNQISVAHAVTCSAAYPLLLPALDREYMFIKAGATNRRRVILTDGGVYDNLGISCLEPGRSNDFSLHSFPADYILSCYAGHGQISGEQVPFGFLGRTGAAFESVFRKVQDAGIQRLHILRSSGNIKGFILSYLGQQDHALPIQPAGLVRREEVFGYPTNFAAMSEESIRRITIRGEQLTRVLIDHYCPEL
jgi:NTE family protein